MYYGSYFNSCFVPLFSLKAHSKIPMEKLSYNLREFISPLYPENKDQNQCFKKAGYG